jgi:predicted phosphodiesterase
MRYGIFADVHANLAALDAALAAFAEAGVDRYLCLGDLVGYGAHPNECVERVAELAPVCVAGNHDLIAVGRLSDAGCTPLARQSLAWTQRVLGDDARRYLECLPQAARVDDVHVGRIVLAHGSLSSTSEYVRTDAQAARQLSQLADAEDDARILLLAHTHLSWAYSHEAGAVLRGRAGRVDVGASGRVLLNPGSVGQSRQWSGASRVLVLDTTTSTAEFTLVSYDIAASRAALRHASLPANSIHLRPSADELARGLVLRLGRSVAARTRRAQRIHSR